ncbi:MAG TPA: shikimate dehydrogenase [Gallionella sp.]|nr:shikimate dehydrogenase [Gallionella sp.]
MTDRYAVIGNPISHSKSPLIHKMFAQQTAQDIRYEAIEAPLDNFAGKVYELITQGYRGCNVTVPFKFEAFKLATELSDRAQAAQAVNTLRFNGDGIFGDNTDGAGLVTDITHNLNCELSNKRVLLVGAGGAAWGVLLPLLNEVPQRLVIANRTVAKAEEAAQTLLSGFTEHISHSTEFVARGFSDLVDEEFDVVINATSAGLTDSEIPLPPTLFAPRALAYDMMYGRETPFMKFARTHGAAVVADGLGMLVEQAAEAFYLWRGVRPDTRAVLEQLRGTKC